MPTKKELLERIKHRKVKPINEDKYISPEMMKVIKEQEKKTSGSKR